METLSHNGENDQPARAARLTSLNDPLAEGALELDPPSDILRAHAMGLERLLEDPQPPVEVPAQDGRELEVRLGGRLSGVALGRAPGAHEEAGLHVRDVRDILPVEEEPDEDVGREPLVEV